MAGTKAWSVFGELQLTGLGETTRKLAAFNAAGATVGQSMVGLNKKALLVAGGIGVAGGAIAAFGISSVRNFAQFDAAMNQSLAIMDNVSVAMREDMANAAIEMSRTTVFSAEQAAESYFFLASAGLSAEQSIAALPQVAAFAQAGMFDMALATDLATDAQSALGLTVDDAAQNLENMTRVTDVLVKANTLANATVQQFSTALTSDAGAAAKAYGVSLEETVAVLAAYADQGVKAEKAGSSFGRLLRLLIPAVRTNAAAFEEYNIEVFDGIGNLLPMADILQDMEEAFGDLSPRAKEAALDQLGFKKRVQQVILPLIGTSEAVRDYSAALDEAGGTTQRVADRQLNTLTAQWGLVKDNITASTIASGDFVAESLELLNVLRGINEQLQATNPNIEGFGESFGRAIDVMKLAFPFLLPLSAEMNKLADAGERAASYANWRRLRSLVGGGGDGEDGTGGGPDTGGGGGAAGGRTLRDMLSLMGAQRARQGMLGRQIPGADRALPGGIGLDALTGSTDFSRSVRPQDLSAGMEPLVDEYQVGLAKQLNEAATKTQNELYPVFVTMGSDLIRGLVDGTFSVKEFLTDSLISLATSAILGPLKGTLGIFSPSEETRKMGQQLVAGFQAGIQESSAGMAAMAGRVQPNLTLDFTDFPAARNPMAMVRDSEWQEFWRRSSDVAARDGHVAGGL